jgi:hypothetical protein
MTRATLYQITDRARSNQFAPGTIGDFTTDTGLQVDSSTVLDPCWSLYNLDLDTGLAHFVWLDPATDLASAAFVFQTQYAAARKSLTLPLDDFIRLSQGLTRPANLILLFSIGRCGTTLANHILNTAPETRALSEPRAFVTLALARPHLSPERATALITAATLFSLRPLYGAMPANMVIKFHSQALYQADLYHQAFPQARLIFMYRDAKGWANSFSGFLQNMGLGRTVPAAALPFNWSMLTASAPLADLSATLDVQAAETPHAQVLACGWAHNLAQFRRLSRAGVPFFTLHYDDLTQDRAGSVRRLLAHCGLPDSTLSDALATFDHDSQQGTGIGRGGRMIPMDADDLATVVKTLARVPDPVNWDIRL